MNKAYNKHVAVIFLLTGLLLSALPSAATLKHLPVGSEAPGFTLKNTRGEDISLDDLLGEKLTLLIFWASWSTKSETALKRVQVLFEKHNGRGLSIAGINTEGESGNAQEVVTSMVGKLKLGFPNIIDYGLNTFRDYGVIAVPTIVILDKERTIRYVLSGFPIVGTEEMAKFITATLEGRKLSENITEKIDHQPDKRAGMLFNTGNNILLRSRSNTDAAERWFLKSIEADPKFSAPHISLGRFYLERAQIDKAKDHFRQAVSIEPGNASALCELGMIIINSGDMNEGEALIAKGIKNNEAYTPCYYYLGYAYGKRSDIEQSLKMFEKAKEINKTDYDIYIYQAKVFEENKNHEAAAESYRRSLEYILKLERTSK